MFNKTLYQSLLEARANNLQTSGSTARNLLPGMASKFNPSAFTKVINPESGANINSKVPVGRPIAPIAIPAGMAVEESVKVVINTVALGLTAAKQRIILFDEGQWFRKKNAIASAFPAGSVYIGSAANDLYPSWVAGTCANTYIFDGVKMDVSPAAGAAATADMQFAEPMTAWYLNTRDAKSSELDISNYDDPSNYNRNTRIITLTDHKSRVDRQAAWDLQVYHGMVVTLTFFNTTYAKD